MEYDPVDRYLFYVIRFLSILLILDNKITNQDKLLSHRLRGFSEIEHTKSALLNALRSEVRYIEVDTRAGNDGQIYIHHNPTADMIEGKVKICEKNEEKIKSLHYINGEHLLRLVDFLHTFKERASANQLFCLDIKDYGFEDNHLELVRKFDLESQTIFISWIPQTILRLREIGTVAPLFLSHLNLRRLGLAGSFLHSFLKDKIFRIGEYIVMGAERMESPLNGLSHGFQHALICNMLPTKFVGLLSETNGGIGVPTKMVCPELIKFVNDSNLKLMVFSVEKLHSYLKYSSMAGVDIVFCDDVPKMLRDLT
jgi:glycerophosphoryl diester phosphodiesterase